MTFDWSAYYVLAEYLADPGSSVPDREAALRSAISRAYFAAYRTLRNHLYETKNYRPSRDREDHREVRDWLMNHRCGGIAEDLRRLASRRGMADYDNEIGNLEKETQAALMLAQDILEKTPRI